MGILKPYAYRSVSAADYVDELTRIIYLITEADPELRAKAAAVLTSHASKAQDSPRPETHRVIVRYERQVGGVLQPVYDEHPVGTCANCGGP